MKKAAVFLLKIFLIVLILPCFSCKQSASDNEVTLFDEWNNIAAKYYQHELDKAALCKEIQEFKTNVDSYFSAESNSYPETRNANISLINGLSENLGKIINICSDESGAEVKNGEDAEIETLIMSVNHTIAFIEHNNYISLRKTNQQYVKYFILLVFTCILIVVLLIYFNNKEITEKQDQLTASKTYLKYIIRTQEDERSRISRELHDTIAQDMRYIGLLAGKLPDNEISVEVQKRQRDCINQIRTLCYDFAPPDIKTGNMKAALETLVSEFLNKTPINLRLTVLENVDFSVFNTDELLHFYRIVQEALNNIEKHASATEATILFRCDEMSDKKIYKLVITDDGSGIDSKLLEDINSENFHLKKSDGNHFGISGMKERAALLNGTITFDSIPGEGTEVIVCVERK